MPASLRAFAIARALSPLAERSKIQRTVAASSGWISQSTPRRRPSSMSSTRLYPYQAAPVHSPLDFVRHVMLGPTLLFEAWLVLGAVLDRRLFYMMHAKYYDLPALNGFFRMARCIVVESGEDQRAAIVRLLLRRGRARRR